MSFSESHWDLKRSHIMLICSFIFYFQVSTRKHAVTFRKHIYFDVLPTAAAMDPIATLYTVYL